MKILDSQGRVKSSQSSSVLRETSGPTNLVLGSVSDGQLLKRSGSTLIGATEGLWKKLATATASSSATIDFTGLSSSCTAYKIVFSNVAPATDGAKLNIRTSANNGSSYDSGASDYQYRSLRIDSAAGISGNAGTGTLIQMQGDGIGNASNRSASGFVEIANPAATAFCKMSWLFASTFTDGGLLSTMGSGWRASAAAVNAIRFIMSSGNIASGQFDLYGLAA